MMGMIANFATAGAAHYRPNSTLSKALARHLGTPRTPYGIHAKYGATYVALLGQVLTYHDTSLDSLAIFVGGETWSKQADPRRALASIISAKVAAAAAQADWSAAHPELYTPWHSLSTLECYQHLAERVKVAAQLNGVKRTHRALLRAFSALRVPAAHCIGHAGDELLAKYTLAHRMLTVREIRVVGSFDSFVMNAGAGADTGTSGNGSGSIAGAGIGLLRETATGGPTASTVALAQRNLREYFALTPAELGKHVNANTDLDIDMLQVTDY